MQGVRESIPALALALVVASMAAACATAGTAPSTTGPRAERPTYALGDRWIRNDGVWEVIRVEPDFYVFSKAPGEEIHLTKDLSSPGSDSTEECTSSSRRSHRCPGPSSSASRGRQSVVLDWPPIKSLTTRGCSGRSRPTRKSPCRPARSRRFASATLWSRARPATSRAGRHGGCKPTDQRQRRSVSGTRPTSSAS